MKKMHVMFAVFAFSSMLISATFAADEGAVKARKAGMSRSNFAIVYGDLSKIDASDPNNIKLEIINESDKETHTISVVPATNITKATDVSELKAGDKVRVMARKVGQDEVALGVMFGKIRKSAQRPVAHSGKMIPQAPEPKAQKR